MEILTLGSKIKNRRKELNLTLKDLAGDRVTPAQLSYVETDKCKPSLDLLEYIGDKLGLEMDYLLESERKQVSQFCEYNIKVSLIEIIRGNYNSAQKSIDQVVRAAQDYELNFFLGEAEKCLGLMYKNMRQYDAADIHYFNSLKIFSKIDDIKKVAEVYMELGLSGFSKKHYNSSLGYLKQAEHFAEKLEQEEVFLKLKIYYHIMTLYERLYDIEKTVYYGNRISQCLDFIDDKVKYGEVLISTAKSFEKQNKIKKALEYMERSLNVFMNVSNTKLKASIQTDLGNIYSKNNMIDESFAHLYKAWDIKKIINDDTIPITLIEIAKNYIIKKDFDKALEAINEALNMSIRMGNREFEASAYLYLFKAFMAKGDYIKAEESIRRCADILEGMSSNKELANCYLTMGEFYKKINREKEGVEYVLKSISIYRGLVE